MSTTAVLLSCSDPVDGRRPDPHFVPETRAARELGAVVGLVDHDALLAGYPGDAVRRAPRDAGPAWYRGWMIPSADYRALEEALAGLGTPLRTSAAQYRAAHELPSWYPVFEGVTPRSAWFAHEPLCPPLPGAVARLAAALPGARAGIVKDYVKSAKHLWSTACHVPDLADRDALERVVAAFLAEQAEFLAGGVVLREFEDFGGPDSSRDRGQDRDQDRGREPEARVWWLDGRPVLTTAHPDTPKSRPEPDLTEVAPRVRALPARFVSTDLARRRDGVWRVIEVGDGQVTGLPAGADPAQLVGLLLAG
jgi:hypothetical protein